MQRIFYHNILSQMQTFYDAFYTKPKREKKPKISLLQIATIFLMSYITNAPVLTSARLFIANVNRTRTQRIKRFAGGVFWAKRKRNVYSQHYKGRVKWEELYYGVLVMVLCDETGVVYDIWFKLGNWHEMRAHKERKRRSSLSDK